MQSCLQQNLFDIIISRASSVHLWLHVQSVLVDCLHCIEDGQELRAVVIDCLHFMKTRNSSRLLLWTVFIALKICKSCGLL